MSLKNFRLTHFMIPLLEQNCPCHFGRQLYEKISATWYHYEHYKLMELGLGRLSNRASSNSSVVVVAWDMRSGVSEAAASVT